MGGRPLRLSNLDKVFYPRTGFTKRDVIDYYTRVAPALLPHLEGRPLTLKRYPNGVEGEFFYEKRCPSHRPDWVRTHPVWSEGNEGFIDFCVVDDLPSLIWVANLASLELHTYQHVVAGPRRKSRDWLTPTMLLFDLDPGPPAGIAECCDVALLIRGLLETLRLESWPKTSGSKGMQLCVPLNTPVTYRETGAFAHATAQLLESSHPDRVTSRMSKQLRTGKVFVDWSQNDDNKTTVSVYSLRAKDEPSVSTPLTWEEVEACARTRDANRLVFLSADVIERVGKHGDLFEPVLRRKQRLPELS